MSYFEDESSPLSDLDNLKMMFDTFMEMDDASQNNINGWLKNLVKKAKNVVVSVGKWTCDFCKKQPETCEKNYQKITTGGC